MDEICVAKFDVYECRKSDRASALSGAQLNICAAQTPEFPDTIPTIGHYSNHKSKRKQTKAIERLRARKNESKLAHGWLINSGNQTKFKSFSLDN